MLTEIREEIRQQVFMVIHSKNVKRTLGRIPLVRAVYRGWNRHHPFDREYGTDTSGFIPVESLQPDATIGKLMAPYGASQPGVIRRVFSSLPDKEKYTLVDLGCGKGRPLLLASEFRFKEIIGVDISHSILETARANAETIHRQFPSRTPIEIVQGNACQFAPASDHVVFFLYHAFEREGVEQFVATLERKIVEANVFVVYYNPVWGAVLDASAHLSRWSAETIPYDRAEVGFGPDLTDTVVVWQSLPERYESREGANRQIVVVGPSRAELASPGARLANSASAQRNIGSP